MLSEPLPPAPRSLATLMTLDPGRRRANYSLIAIFSITTICLTLADVLVIALRWTDVYNSANVPASYHIAIVVLLGIVFLLTAGINIALVAASDHIMTGKSKHWIHGVYIACLLLTIPTAGLLTYSIVEYSQGILVYNAMTAATAITWILVIAYLVLIGLTTLL